jgi:hypothetical protein
MEDYLSMEQGTLKQFGFTGLLMLSLLFAACDQPPDPDMPRPVRDAYNITEFADAILAGLDVSGYIKLEGSWESFASPTDPLGKLYTAVSPLYNIDKKIKLDFTKVTGSNIAVTGYVTANTRGGKTVIEAIKLPAEMTRIGEYSFWDCSNLELIVFNGNMPPEIPVSALTGVHSPLTLLVPNGMGSNYAALKANLEGVISEVTIETAQ